MTESGQPVAGAPTPRGRTTISERALRRLAVGIAGDAGRVSARDVRVDLADAQGSLRAAVAVPVALGDEATTIDERSDTLRRAMVDRMLDLAGRRVSIVDVTFTGVRRIERRRVT